MIKIEEIESGKELFENARIGGDQFRLDSAGEREWERWSYRAEDSSLWLSCNGDGRAVLLGNGKIREWSNPLEALQWMEGTLKREEREGPPFKGGWVGYVSYDLGRWLEKLPSRAVDDLKWPIFCFRWHERVLAHDGLSGKNFQVWAAPPVDQLPRLHPTHRARSVWGEMKSTFTRNAYERCVERALEYIGTGDVFQVNLSQRFEVPMLRAASEVYGQLRRKFPAGFAGLLDFGSTALISNSPELFLKVDAHRKVTTRPIKGTRPKSAGMDRELKNSAKDQAELNMIVDLERNDLGRICEIGSVKVISAREIEALPTVYHGVATIEGHLRNDVGLVELLRATFPGGSVTGAPKIRAMEIIEELEPVRRGPYCGAIGYLSADGQIGLNIAIRTIVANEGRAYVSVGGGIVADSKPDEEYEETLVKAQAMFEVLK